MLDDELELDEELVLDELVLDELVLELLDEELDGGTLVVDDGAEGVVRRK